MGVGRLSLVMMLLSDTADVAGIGAARKGLTGAALAAESFVLDGDPPGVRDLRPCAAYRR
jgi:hypothetical protein